MRWVRPWLGCVALLYPAYWLATVLVWVLPAVLRGETIERYEVSPFGAFALARASWIGWLIVLAICALLLIVEKLPGLTGLIVACAGFASYWPIARMGGRGGKLPVVLAIILIACGLRKLLCAAPEARYAGRVLFLIAVVAAPFLAIPLAVGVPRFVIMRLLEPVAAASLLACVVSLRWRGLAARPAGWAFAAAGLAATVGIALSAGRAGAAMNERRERAAVNEARAAVATLPAVDQDAPFEKKFFQRGVNFTAEFPAGYMSEMARETIRLLPRYGVNAIALVPYGSISSPKRFGGGWESDEGIETLSRVAHSVGMKVMLKPQLWGRTWPADFEPATETDRREWFAQYGTLVEHYAQLAMRIHTDLLCVGTELSKMTRHEAEWRALIARARANYKGPITYAAVQGPEFENLRFWDALDYIGLSDYYPLPDGLDTSEVVSKVEVVQKRFGKPVIFAEAGFSSYEAPNRAPWDESPRRLAPQDQARCYEAVFGAFYKKPWFQGVYWWKIGSNRQGGLEDGSHTPWGKPAMDVMKRWYTTGGR